MTLSAPKSMRTLPAPPALVPRGSALFADLDGTLAPIRARPEDVGPDPARAHLLAGLSTAFGGRLAVISGRGLADLDRLLEGQVTTVAAVHGLVRRDARGQVASAAAHPGLAPTRAALAQFTGIHPGLIVEDKEQVLALHYRGAPEAEGAALDLAETLAARFGLDLQPGDMVIDLKTPGADKGAAVRAFMAEAPFQGARPVYIGDDLTDEAGFAAAASLGGYGVVVGGRPSDAAAFRLPTIEAARQWLTAALED